MQKALKNRLLVILFISFFLFSCISKTQDKNSILIMTYNTENLFDDIDNGTEYPEYDPCTGNWTTEKFNEKLDKIAEVIKYIDPDIAALQELENENVLNTLCDKHLTGYTYRVIYPVKNSAINCAIISKLKIENVNIIVPVSSNNILRTILEIKININGSILYVFNSHWKSKLGGTEVTEKERLLSSGLISERIKDILHNQVDADIIVLGDFNENVNEYTEVGKEYITALMPVAYIEESYSKNSLFISGENNNVLGTEEEIVLYESWFEYNLKDIGSYVYKGKWQTPDHILLSSGLFNKNGFFYSIGNFNIVNDDFLIDNETGFPLKKKYAEYIYSDHLPLLIRIFYDNAE